MSEVSASDKPAWDDAEVSDEIVSPGRSYAVETLFWVCDLCVTIAEVPETMGEVASYQAGAGIPASGATFWVDEFSH